MPLDVICTIPYAVKASAAIQKIESIVLSTSTARALYLCLMDEMWEVPRMYARKTRDLAP